MKALNSGENMYRLLNLLWLWLFAASSLFAQVTEDFSDGDFSANPVWIGTADSFTVEAGQLRTRPGNASSATLTLFTATNETFTSWEFFFRFSFNPSTLNFAEFWLATDDTDPSQAQNGYFVRLGGNSGDGIGLYRKQNGSTSAVIAPSDTFLNNPGTQGYIRVLRNGNNWSLFQKITGPDYELAGTGTESFSFPSQGIAILVRSTKTNRGKHYFDDIRAENLAGPDVTPPSLLGATALNATQIDLTFSEATDEVFSAQTSLYSFTPSLSLQSAVRQSDPSRVRLTLSAPMGAGSYTVQVAQSKDLAGNLRSTPESQTFSFDPGQPAGSRTVVINELMADETPPANPGAPLPVAEYVELHNPGTAAVNLKDWILSDLSTQANLPAVTLPAGGYLILCRQADSASFSTFGSVAVVALPSLNNSGDRITLKNQAGLVVDEVDYNLTWYQNPQKDDGGFSLEQINPNRICSGRQNWRASESPAGGTPGIVNSLYNPAPDTSPPIADTLIVVSADTLIVVFNEEIQTQNLTASGFELPGSGIQTLITGRPDNRSLTLVLSPALTLGQTYTLTISGVKDCEGNAMPVPLQRSLIFLPPAAIPFRQLVINEIYADETPSLGLPKVEYIELFNPGNQPRQLKGCSLRVGSSARPLPPHVLYPNQYLILTRADSAASFSGLGPVKGMDFPQLTNTGAEIRLTDLQGNDIDRVAYTLDWYGNTSKDDGGFSLEQINPFRICSGASNWTASTAPTGGTPGKQNSEFSNLPDTLGPVLTGVEILGPQTIQLNFSEPLGSDPATDSLGLTGFTGTIETLYSFPGPESVALTLDPPMQPGTLYILRGKGIPDCSGNLSAAFSAPVGTGLTPDRFDLLITEVQSDDSPSGGLPQAEWLELENRSGKLLQLKGVMLSDGSSEARFPDYLLPAGERLVVSGTSGAPELAAGLPGVRVLGVTSFPSLSQDGEKLFLLNGNGAWVHRFFYKARDYSPWSLLEKGWSLEMIDPSNPCDEKGNWAVCTAPEGGTPGKVNSVNAAKPDASAPDLVRLVIPGPRVLKLVLNELTDSISLAGAEITVSENLTIVNRRFEPGDFSQLFLDLSSDVPVNTVISVTLGPVRDCAGNTSGVKTVQAARPNPARAGDWMLNEILFDPRTGGSDYLEIRNRSPHYLDLGEIRVANREEGKRVTEEITPVEPGGLVLLTTSIPLTLRDYPRGNASRFVETSLPTFSADSGTVRILGPSGEEWEKYFYSEKHHARIIDETKGVSLERIAPGLPAENSDSWQSASRDAGFGTPGLENSQSRDYDPVAGFAADPEVFSPNGDGNRDFTFFRYTSDKPGLIASLRVYNADGHLVKRVTETSNLGTENEWKWDGRTEEGRLARMGMYMAVLEVTEPGGSARSLRIPVAIAHDR